MTHFLPAISLRAAQYIMQYGFLATRWLPLLADARNRLCTRSHVLGLRPRLPHERSVFSAPNNSPCARRVIASAMIRLLRAPEPYNVGVMRPLYRLKITGFDVSPGTPDWGATAS